MLPLIQESLQLNVNECALRTQISTEMNVYYAIYCKHDAKQNYSVSRR
jgi:hypothetical protein